MAGLRFLGFSEPSALPYLVNEGILPADPPESSYKWETYYDHMTRNPAFEELLSTDYCVVWSRGGIVQKVFSFDVEQQKIQQAILTTFPEASEKPSQHLSLGADLGEHDHISRKRRKFVPQHGIHSDATPSDPSRAIVIFLKLQAHIFFLSGSNHVINLPFEVEKAYASPRGLILQRKIPTATAVPETPVVPPPPNNSFFSPYATRGYQPSQPSRFNDKKKTTEKKSLAGLDFELLRPTQVPAADNLPRHFTLSDPLSEVGLIIGSDEASTSDPKEQSTTQDLDTLCKDEEILYFSSTDEVPPGENDTGTPLLLMVTANYQKQTFSIWHAMYLGTKPVSTLFAGRKVSSSGASTRRRSSFVSGTGTTTPTIRGRESIRESFGGIARGKQAPGLTESQLKSSRASQSAEDAILSQLDPENDSRQPAKESRRVSSLLSRADLSTNFDRSAFHDLATQHAVPVPGSQQHGRRGQSLGASGSRNSLGLAGGRRNLRASTPGSFSRLSMDDISETGTMSNFGASTTVTIDELDEQDWENYPLEGEVDIHQPIDGLKKEIFVIKACSDIPMRTAEDTDYGHQGSHRQFSSRSSFGGLTEDMTTRMTDKVFTSYSPRMPTDPSSAIGRRLFVHLLSSNSSHIQVELSVIHRRMASQINRNSPTAISTQAFLVPREQRVARWKNIDSILPIRSDNAVWLAFHVNSNARTKSTEIFVSPPWCPELASAYDLAHVNLTHIELEHATGRNRSGGSSGLDKSTASVQEVCGLENNGPNGAFDIRVSPARRMRIQVDLVPCNTLVCNILDICIFVFPTSVGAWIMRCWQQLCQESSSDLQNELQAILQVLLRLALCLNESKEKASPTGRHQRGRKPSASKRLSTGQTSTTSSDSHGEVLATQHQRRISRGLGLEPPFHKILNEARTYAAFATSAESRQFLQKHFNLAKIGMARLVTALHLLLEERRLNVLTPLAGVEDLVGAVCQMGRWMAWTGWDWKEGGYYSFDLSRPHHYEFEDVSLDWVACPELQAFQEPPSVFGWLERCFNSATPEKFPTISSLFELLSNTNPDRTFLNELGKYNERHIDAFSTSITPRIVALSRYFERTKGHQLPAQRQVETMVECGVTMPMLETLPEAASASFKEAIIECRAHPPSTWSTKLLSLVNREELTLTEGKATAPAEPLWLAGAFRDIHGICHFAEDALPSVGPDLDRWSISRLIFSEDRRFIEALRMIEPVRLTAAECIPDPSWSEAQLFEAQKEVVQLVMVRTFALAPGLGMAQYNSRRPLLTEKYIIPGYSTACLMKPMNNTIMADRTTFTEEKYGWAWFHAGVAAGLAISKDAQGIDTSWIVFNKPPEPNNRHAGLLLALGLNGHLKGIAKWLAFKYLTPKHTMTSIGLLLGMSASHLGTMDTLVTRLLSVHVTRMLPPGAAELNLSPLAQTTGLMGIGLLYYNTQHRRMTEIMLSEIENAVSEDPSSGSPDPIRDESYRLAAGFALGHINIGAGKDLKGLHDMRLVERLLAIAVGSRPVDLVHILDQATAGATIAIALIYMKTHNTAVARKIDIPDTLPQFDYVRPDILLIRTLAKHLILWSSIRSTETWILSNLPPAYHAIHTLIAIKDLRSQHLPLYTILTGLLFAIALRHSGSASLEVRDFLLQYLDQFIRLSRLPATHYDARLTRSTVHHCLDLLSLCCAIVMAGTGDILVMRRLRLLHGRVNQETTYGAHMASHMALGALFLGGGSYSFGTSDLAVASLLVSFYPLFPSTVDDSRAHLQALRHFWVMAIEPRCVVARDAETRRPISLGLEVTVRSADGDEETRGLKAPCLLPDLATVVRIRTKSEEYWPISLDFKDAAGDLERFKRDQTLFVKKRPPHQPGDSPFFTSLMALNNTHMKGGASKALPWEWLFDLQSFKDFRKTEFGLVVPSDDKHWTSLDGKSSVIDDRLVLSRHAKESWDKNQLWNLRVLFAWAERQMELKGEMRYLGREVVELLKGVLERRRDVDEDEQA